MDVGYIDYSKLNTKQGPDNTPVRKYEIRLSDRQVQSLKSLKSRNYAGLILGVVNEAAAVTKAIDQIVEEGEQKNVK